MSASAPRRSVDLIDRRVGVMFAVFVLLLAVAVGRAAYLGTFRSGALTAAANEEHLRIVHVPAVRGEITDRNGDPLAVSEAVDQMIADPILIQKGNPERVAAKLAPLLHVKQAKLRAELTEPDSGYVVLTRATPAATAAKVMALGINGINETPIEQRYYPEGRLGSQMVGWLNANGQGVAGIEYVLNGHLHGTSGVQRIINDAAGKPISVANSTTMVPGQNVALTVSAPLQAEVQRVLAGVAREYHPHGATAIVTDPQTDQILALANWPSMNDNDVTSADLQGTASHIAPSEDMAVDFDYEPGSTFKAITVAGALQDKLISPGTEFDIPPYLRIDGKKISDAETHGYETLSVADILKVSSNIGADLIAQKLGAARFSEWVSRFGFGKPTGVALNGEGEGIVPTLAQYSPVSMWNLPFGQGQEVTPIQMVQAYDTIADGGIMRRPQLIQSIGGVKQATPRGHRVISASVAYQLRNMLRGVLADGGTASGAAIPGYDMAGKTGTAEIAINGRYSKTQYVASFIGMVPASHPKLVIAVVVDRPENGDIYGGSVAGPAFQKIAAWAVPHFGINPCPSPCPASALNPALSSSL